MRYFIIFFSSCLIILFLFVNESGASTVELFGMGARAQGLGNAFSAVADDASALYYNPAGLVRLKGNYTYVGYLYGTPRLKQGDTEIPAPSEKMLLFNTGYPLKGKMEGKLAFGFSLYYPQGKILHMTMHRVEEPYFLLYENQIEVLHIRMGVGWRPLSFLSVGFSALLLSALDGYIYTYEPFQPGDIPREELDPTKRLVLSMDQDIPSTASFTIGLLADIGKYFSVGLTYRNESDLPMVNKLDMVLEIVELGPLGYAPILVDVDVSTRYTPTQLTLGTSYQGRLILLGFDLTWAKYSKYTLPAAYAEIDFSRIKEFYSEKVDEDFAEELIEGLFKLNPPKEPVVSLKDVLIPRVGVEGRLSDLFRLRGGYYFEPSFIESTDCPIFDSDKHSISMGGGLSFINPMGGIVKGRLNIDLTFQTIIFTKRRFLGDEIGGQVYSGSLGMDVTF